MGSNACGGYSPRTTTTPSSCAGPRGRPALAQDDPGAHGPRPLRVATRSRRRSCGPSAASWSRPASPASLSAASFARSRRAWRARTSVPRRRVRSSGLSGRRSYGGSGSTRDGLRRSSASAGRSTGSGSEPPDRRGPSAPARARARPWSAGVICLQGLGRYERGLVGDLGLIKLVAALRGRQADAAETEELLEPYAEWGRPGERVPARRMGVSGSSPARSGCGRRDRGLRIPPRLLPWRSTSDGSRSSAPAGSARR